LTGFLLAELYFDLVAEEMSRRKVENILRNLRRGSGAYDYAYEKAMNRIPYKRMKLAKQVLSWIICAKRPLTTLELQHALAVEDDMSELDNLPQLEDIVSICVGLVTIDKRSNVIRLVHYTAHEYFDRTRGKWFPNAESEITTTCITYLSSTIFESGICQTDEDFEERLQSNQFFEYAARNWGHHARIAPTSDLVLNQTVAEFLRSETKVDASSQGLFAFKYDWTYIQQVPKFKGVHLAAYFGVEVAMKLLLESATVDADLKDSFARTPFSYAMQGKHEAVTKLLLKTGNIDSKLKNDYRQMLLSIAADNEQEADIKLLLKIGKVNVNLKDDLGQTLLSRAAENGNEAVIKLLLKTGKVDLNLKDDFGQTPLSRAASNGHEVVIRLLLDTGKVQADSRCIDNRTPLSFAAEHGHEVIVNLLLEKGVEIDSKDICGRTPLQYAIMRGHERVAALLLSDCIVNVNCENEDGQTILILAVRNGFTTIVQRLLQFDNIDVDKEDKFGTTPLLCAAESRHQIIFNHLLDKGANIGALQKYYLEKIPTGSWRYMLHGKWVYVRRNP